MHAAVKKAVEANDGNENKTVGLSGTWQLWGHKSLNGDLSATSLATGKVLDIEILSKYYQICNYVKDGNKNKKKTFRKG